jgi:hypothetical protein
MIDETPGSDSMTRNGSPSEPGAELRARDLLAGWGGLDHRLVAPAPVGRIEPVDDIELASHLDALDEGPSDVARVLDRELMSARREVDLESPLGVGLAEHAVALDQSRPDERLARAERPDRCP